jgi:simple sugar transport system ATP-binding protein
MPEETSLRMSGHMPGHISGGAGDSSAVPPRIRLSGIRKSFGSVKALRGVDLELQAGECLGLVGDNAAGKSTLSKVISGTYIPDAGTMSIDGEAVRLRDPADARDRHIEMVYQDLSLCNHIDVVGNLFLGRERVRGPFLDSKRMLEEARHMLDALEIRIPRLSAKVAQLSGGQRQAIAIARAASFDPKVLIMDEPTSALAVAEVEAVLELINRVKARGVSVILITHRLQDLFRVCDRIAVMYEGTKVAERATASTHLEELVRLIVGDTGLQAQHRVPAPS